MSGILESLKSNIYNSNVTKSVTGIGVGTPYGGDFIPNAVSTDGQKRFSTKEPLPNLPKPKSKFYTYFSLNPEATQYINKKRELIEYLAKFDNSSNKVAEDLDENIINIQKSTRDSGLFGAISEAMDPALTMLGDAIDTVSDVATTVIGSVTDVVSGVVDTATDLVGSAISGVQGAITDVLGIDPFARTEGGIVGSAAGSVRDNIDTELDSKTFGDYIPDKYVLQQLAFEMSKFVKNINKPKISFETTELNEYNRKRLVYNKQTFSDLTVTFYDVKENPVQQMLFTYLKLINNTFLCKTHKEYSKEIPNRTNKNNPLDIFGFTTDSGFKLIDRISVIDFYMDRMMVYTYENPIITDIDFGEAVMGDFSPNEIKVTFQFEGITNDLIDIDPYLTDFTDSNQKSYLKAMINSSIRADMASFLQMNYQSGSSFAVDTGVSYIKGILDAAPEKRWSVAGAQLLDTGRKMGFADEIDFIRKSKSTVEEFKNTDNEGRYILKVLDDPTSIIGRATGSESSGLLNIKNLF